MVRPIPGGRRKGKNKMALNEPKLLSEFLQFMQDLPFASVGAAIASGGTNIAVDIAAAEAIAQAAVKDFFGGASTASAPATAAAVSAVTN
jgi:hypothetical protein